MNQRNIQKWVSYKTITTKQIKRILRVWTQTLLPSVITISLYYIIFGSLVGSRIGDMGGFDYMAFIVPGLIMMAVITNSYTNVVSAFFGEKFGKSIEELLVSPTPSWIVIAGYVTGGVFRGILVGLIVTLISLFFTKLIIVNLFVLISSVLLTSILFSLGGLINGIYAKKFDQVQIFPVFILTPLTYLGGVFYSIKLLPPFWQSISLANPILYMVNIFRYGFLGVSDINIITAYSMIIIVTVGLTYWANYLLTKGYGMRS